MNRQNSSDWYFDLYQRISSVNPETVSREELNVFAENLGAEILNETSDFILTTLSDMALREYLYHWSLELRAETATEKDLQILALFLGIEKLVGTTDEIIKSLRLEAKFLAGKLTTIRDLPLEILVQIIGQVPSQTRRSMTEVSRDFQVATRTFDRMNIDVNNLLIIASGDGDADVVLHTLKRGATSFKEAIIAASGSGYENITQILIDQQRPTLVKTRRFDYEDAMYQMNKTPYLAAMLAAARGGHVNIVVQMYNEIYDYALVISEDVIDRAEYFDYFYREINQYNIYALRDTLRIAKEKDYKNLVDWSYDELEKFIEIDDYYLKEILDTSEYQFVSSMPNHAVEDY